MLIISYNIKFNNKFNINNVNKIVDNDPALQDNLLKRNLRR